MPVLPRSKYFWLKLILAVVAGLSFTIVLVEEKVWTWWQQRSLCKSSAYAQQAPVIYAEQMLIESEQLCGQNLLVLYSGISKTPLWITQFLSATVPTEKQLRPPELALHHQVHLSAQQAKESIYQPLLALENSHQALLPVIKVPFATQQQAQQWQMLDKNLTALSQSYHQDIYVITGTDYNAENLAQIQGQIWQPHAVYKAVYIPETGVIGAYYLKNQAHQNIEYMSICALEQKLKTQLFPQLTSEQKRDVYQLPLAHMTDFNWQYAYWDNQSQCDAESLKTAVKDSNAATIFTATPWLKRLEMVVLSVVFTLLDWLLVLLATG